MVLSNHLRRVAATVVLVSLTTLGACSDAPGLVAPTLDGTGHDDPLLLLAVNESLAEIEKAPEAPGPRAELGKYYAAVKLHTQSRTCFEHAIELGDDDPKTRSYLAYECKQQGDLDSALRWLAKAREMRPNYAPNHWEAGLWILEDGRPEEAEPYFAKAIEVNPKDLEGHVGLARVYLQTGRPQEAYDLLEVVRETGGRLKKAYASYLSGMALSRLGRAEEAEALLAGGTIQDQTRSHPWRRQLRPYRRGLVSQMQEARRAIRSGRVDEAIEICELLMEHHSDARALVDNLASCYIQAGRTQDAHDLLVQYEHDPAPSANSCYLLAQCKRQLGAPAEEVAALIRDSHSLNERFGPTLVYMAEELMAKRSWREALEHLEVAVTNDSPLQVWRVHAGDCAMNLREWSRAVAHFEEAAVLGPVSPAVQAKLERAKQRVPKEQ